MQLRIEPADIEGELQKNGQVLRVRCCPQLRHASFITMHTCATQGALGEKWAEQQAKVLRAKAQDSVKRRRTSSRKDPPVGEADAITSDKQAPKTSSVRRGRRGSTIGVKYELKD